MRRVLKLSLAFLKEHPLRLILTSLATIAATCMVVWVVSGYDALLHSFKAYSNDALGNYTLAVAPISDFRQWAPGAVPEAAEGDIPRQVVRDLRADKAVIAADPMWAVRTFIVAKPRKNAAVKKQSTPAKPVNTKPKSKGSGIRGRKRARLRRPDIRLIGTNTTQPPFELVAGRWMNPKSGKLEATMSADAAERLKVGLNDSLLVDTSENQREVTIVGLINSPSITSFAGIIATSQLMTPSVGGLYVSTKLAEQVTGRTSKISFIGVTIDPKADLTQFRFSWSHRLSTYSTPVQFQDNHDVEENLDNSASAENISFQALAVTSMAMLAALFIIFSVLSMGVSERTRQLALLRAVVLTRGEVGLLVVTEGLLLATIGFVGGIACGWILLKIASTAIPLLYGLTPSLGLHAVLLAAACAYGGALCASILPAWRATRVKPVDAMAPQITTGTGEVPLFTIPLGLALIFAYPLVTFAVDYDDTTEFTTLMLSGFVAMAAGFIILAPTVVRLVDKLLSPILARLLGLEPRLLLAQISGRMWSTVSTSLALSIGLGLFIAVQVWGHTMLKPFVPGQWAPDALIGFAPHGINPGDARKVASFPGIDPDCCFPIVVEQPRLKEDLTNSATRATVTRQDSVVIVGLDLGKALSGKQPLLPFQWQQGSPESVRKMLAQDPRACVVPNHFLKEAGLKIGDTFTMIPPDNYKNPATYKVAGSVTMTGWHWQTKTTGFRSRTHRAAALIMADYKSVANDFRKFKSTHVWFRTANNQPINTKDLNTRAQQLYAQSLGLNSKDVAIGPAPFGTPWVASMPIVKIRARVIAGAGQWLSAMSFLPLVTLLVTGLGLLNTIFASVRSRLWEMGVLRSIGFTRSTLVRVVIAEGILIGMVACVLSLGFGVITGWCGAGISQHISFFAGLSPTLQIPVMPILIGLAAALLLAAIAAIWPASSLGRSQPLALLQQGRSAF